MNRIESLKREDIDFLIVLNAVSLRPRSHPWPLVDSFSAVLMHGRRTRKEGWNLPDTIGGLSPEHAHRESQSQNWWVLQGRREEANPRSRIHFLFGKWKEEGSAMLQPQVEF